MTFTALVGRDAELLRLADLLDRTGAGAGGTGGLVTLAGEPGIGKTRLLRELASMAATRGATVLWGSATEFEQQVAFGVFRDALDEALTGLDGAALSGLSEGQLGVLRSLFLSVPGGAPRSQEPMPGDRFHVHRAMRALLDLLTRDRRVVLILDDLHWADDGSIELCQHLARHPPGGGLLVAAAFRPRQVPPGLAAAIGEAARHGRVEHLELGPLRYADAQHLLTGEEVDDETRLRWYTSSEGNPLYLEALARTDTTTADLGHPEAHLQPVQAALARELASLRPVPLTVARAAAVVGDVFEPDVAATVADLDVPTVLAAIDELVRRDLMRPARATGRLQFRHPLVRTVAYESAGPGWRLTAHARAARALRHRGAPAVDQAHHVERYATMGDEASIATLVQAGDTALHTAPAVAAHWFRAALRLLPERSDPGESRLVLLDRLTRSLALSGRLDESRSVTHELLTLLPRSTERRAHVACFCAMVDRLLGRFAEANAVLLAELDDLTDEDNATAVIVKLGLAFGYMLRGDPSAERDWTREAAQTAGRLGDRGLLGSALTVRGLAIMMGGQAAGAPIGDVGEAVRCLTEAADLVDALTDQEFIQHIDALAVLGSAEMMIERYVEAERHLQRVLAATRATGKVHLLTNVTLALGVVYGRTGRLAEASASLDDALEWAVLTASDEQKTMAQSYRCWILGWRGDLAAAAQAGEDAVASAGSVPDYFGAIAWARLAEIRFHTGDLDGCRRILTSRCGGPDLARLDTTTLLRALLLLASVEAAQGNLAEAVRWADRAEAAAAGIPVPLNLGMAELTRAQALLPAGDAAAALAAADRAVEHLRLAGNPVMVGCAHLTAGLALAAAQRVAEARDRFARARKRFEASGARLFLDQTVRAERRMNARLPRRKSARSRSTTENANAMSLTRREYDVAELVSAGLTNRQVAERLHLSTRTVESHLARVFVKLDVSTRAVLARTLDRHRGAQ